MDRKKLLEVRKMRKGSKPKFRAQNYGHKKEVNSSYRRPKGYQSKMRLGIKGRGKMPKPGYQAPAQVRSLNPDGLQEVIVSNVSDLKAVDPKTQIAVISSAVGIKKAIAIATEAEKQKVALANADLSSLQKQFDAMKISRAQKRKARAKKEEAKEKKADKKGEKAEGKEEKKESAVKEKAEESTGSQEDQEEKAKKKEQEKLLINKDKAM